MWTRVGLTLVLICVAGACTKTPEERLAIHKEQAQKYLAAGKLDEALLEFRSALQVAPKDPQLLMAAGDAFLRAKNLREAYQAFRQADELDPDNQDIQLRLAKLFLLAKSPVEAKERAERVLSVDPNRADVHMVMAQASLMEGRLDEAIGHYDHAIRLAPRNIDYLLAKATALLGGSRLAKSREVINKVLEIDPESPYALLLLAQVADLQRDPIAVDSAFSKLLEAKPKVPTVWINYGDFWASKGEPTKAIAAYRQAVELGDVGTTGWEKIAELSLSGRDLDTAREAVRGLYARDADSTTGKYYEARVLLADRKYGEAIPLFNQVISQHPEHPLAYYFLGTAHFANKDILQARAALQKALNIDPKLHKARMLLAQTYLDSRQFDLVLKETESLAGQGRVHPEVLLLRASAFMGQGKNETAIPLLQEIVRADERNFRAREALGLALLAAGKMNEGISVLTKIVKANPENKRPLRIAAQVLLSKGKTAEALALVKDDLGSSGDSSASRVLLGEIYLAAGDRARALEEAERAISLDPLAADAYLLRAALQGQGPEGARRALADVEIALDNRKDNIDGWMSKATLHKILGETKQEEAAYRRVLDLNPDFAPALNNLAWSLLENGGNLDEALKYAEKAVELHPESASMNDTLGYLYAKKGAYLKAVSHLERAAGELWGSPVVHYHLGQAYWGLGEKEKAAASLRKALEIFPGFPGAAEARQLLQEVEAQ